MSIQKKERLQAHATKEIGHLKIDDCGTYEEEDISDVVIWVTVCLNSW